MRELLRLIEVGVVHACDSCIYHCLCTIKNPRLIETWILLLSVIFR